MRNADLDTYLERVQELMWLSDEELARALRDDEQSALRCHGKGWHGGWAQTPLNLRVLSTLSLVSDYGNLQERGQRVLALLGN